MHFAPVSDPAGQTPDGEQHGEHLDWNSQCTIDHAGVEVDVRIEFSFDEVLIFQCYLFQLSEPLRRVGRQGPAWPAVYRNWLE